MVTWSHLVVHLENKGRKISENGVLVNVHTKKKDMTSLPRNMWNAKGKKMMEAAKGGILNDYGSKGWELVSVAEADGLEGIKFYFKKKDK
tara:strand:- start:1298 stop:1567 length:270 start_codon:yes stop_codon:yes gene_type:complete